VKLLQTIEDARIKVRDKDLISCAFAVCGGVLAAITISQPGNPANGARLNGLVALFGVSVAVEHARSKSLATLESAEAYQKRIESDRIRRDVVAQEAAREFTEADEAFAMVQIDRWAELSQRLNIAPPNLDARQVQAPIDVAAVAVAEPDVDPCPPGYDPWGTGETAPAEKSSGFSFIPAAQVAEWLEEKSAMVPRSLIEEWGSNPGTGIQVADGSASIVRGGEA
jgi:hypothetical protein